MSDIAKPEDVFHALQDQVVLVIESAKFLLTMEEAMLVAGILNSCNQLTTKWISSGNKLVISEPTMTSATVTPVTAYMKVLLDQSMKETKK